MTPVTEMGRALVIVMALLGVPLMLMFLVNLGSALGAGIRYMYNKVFCHLCKRQRKIARNQAKVNPVENGKVPVEEPEKKEDDNSHQLPATLIVGIIVLYLLMGEYFVFMKAHFSILTFLKIFIL